MSILDELTEITNADFIWTTDMQDEMRLRAEARDAEARDRDADEARDRDADAYVVEQIEECTRIFSVTESEILAVFSETGCTNVMQLASVARIRRSLQPGDGLMRGVSTEIGETIDLHDETTPFTDDDFDKLIEDIEGLTGGE